MNYKFNFYYAIAGAVLSCFIISSTACTNKVLPVLKTKQQLHASMAWEELDQYPQKVGRSDDLSFVNPDLGWAINSQGVLHKTEDGGESWTLQFEKENSFFRCLVFKDSLNGSLGTLGTDDEYLHSTDPVTLYETHDGGLNWAPTKISGPYPKGLCGMQKVNDQLMVACGRVRGPSYFLKTEDGGTTWVSKDLNHVAGSLIAPHFFDENNGILVGGTTRDKINCRSLILSTEDGGENWDTVYVSQQKGEYLWKISFPTRMTGYISVQRNADDGVCYFLKTTDGGKTWMEKEYANGQQYYAQGIGFLTEQVGWIGGSFRYSYETRDGGENWFPIATGKGLNNFQFVDDTTAYMVGRGIYKLKNLGPLPNGWQSTYYNDGTVSEKKYYNNGLLDGKIINYHPNGQLKQEGQYNQNLKTGTWKSYAETGELIQKLKFKNDIAQIPLRALQVYEGAYRVNKNTLRFIIYKNGQLYSKRSDRTEVFKIYPESTTTFFYESNWDLKITFVKNNKQEVQHTLLFRPGQEWKAMKENDPNALAQLMAEKQQLQLIK